MNKLFKSLAMFTCFGFVSFGGVLASFSSAYADEAKEERAKQFLQIGLQNELMAYLTVSYEKNPNTINFVNIPRIQYVVSASELDKEFESNELRAEKKYGDSLFDVTGKVVGVKRDVMGRAYVELASSKSGLTNMMAYLTSEGANEAADYDNGKTVTLRCKSAKKPLLITLDGCQEMPPAMEEAKKLSEEITTKFLKGEDVSKIVAAKDGKPVSPGLFIIWYVGNNYEIDDACLSVKTIGTSACKAFERYMKDPNGVDNYEKAYDENSVFYHLP